MKLNLLIGISSLFAVILIIKVYHLLAYPLRYSTLEPTLYFGMGFFWTIILYGLGLLFSTSVANALMTIVISIMIGFLTYVCSDRNKLLAVIAPLLVLTSGFNILFMVFVLSSYALWKKGFKKLSVILFITLPLVYSYWIFLSAPLLLAILVTQNNKNRALAITVFVIQVIIAVTAFNLGISDISEHSAYVGGIGELFRESFGWTYLRNLLPISLSIPFLVKSKRNVWWYFILFSLPLMLDSSFTCFTKSCEEWKIRYVMPQFFLVLDFFIKKASKKLKKMILPLLLILLLIINLEPLYTDYVGGFCSKGVEILPNQSRIVDIDGPPFGHTRNRTFYSFNYIDEIIYNEITTYLVSAFADKNTINNRNIIWGALEGNPKFVKVDIYCPYQIRPKSITPFTAYIPEIYASNETIQDYKNMTAQAGPLIEGLRNNLYYFIRISDVALNLIILLVILFFYVLTGEIKKLIRF